MNETFDEILACEAFKNLVNLAIEEADLELRTHPDNDLARGRFEGINSIYRIIYGKDWSLQERAEEIAREIMDEFNSVDDCNLETFEVDEEQAV